MKNAFKISLSILSILLVYSCEQKPTPPIVTTTVVGTISYTTATSGGNVTSDGGSPVISRGICWSTSSDPIISNNKTTNGDGTGEFTSDLVQLLPNTTYYVRSYATNIAGTGYGNQVIFSTHQIAIATITTAEITSVTMTGANTGGNITNENGGTVMVRGVCWSTSQNPNLTANYTTDGTGSGAFTSSITNLTAATTYYVRAYATNSAGTAYGTQVSFTTINIPTITNTTTASSIAITTATSGGNITSDGGAAITSYGVCWSLLINPTILDNKSINSTSVTGSFNSIITGLAPATKYYVRAYATNSAGTAYGPQVNFTTYNADAIKDVENNYYNIVQIGTQVWMQENLRATKFNDNSVIPMVTNNAEWEALTTPGYSWIFNDESYKEKSGALYNWYAVSTTRNGNKNLCPTDWHVPTDSEFSILSNFLINNGYGYMGGIHIGKSMASKIGWPYDATAGNIGNDQATNNSSGFTALPGGSRNSDGTFAYAACCQAFWWSSTQYDLGTLGAFYWSIFVNYSDFSKYSGPPTMTVGLSVRCLKDN